MSVYVIVVFIPFTWVNMEDRETRGRLIVGHVIFCLVAVSLLPYAFMIYAFVLIFKSIAKTGKVKESTSQLSRQAALKARLFFLASMATVKFLECWINIVFFLKKFSCFYCKKKRDISGRAASSVVNDAVDNTKR